MGDGAAHNADEHRHPHRDDHPDRGDAAGEFQLILVPDGHKAYQDVGHSEVAQPPGHHGHDADEAVGGGGVGDGVIGLPKAEEPGQGAGVVQHRVQPSGLHHAEDYDNGQGGGHDDRLDKVHGGHRGEAADGGVADDDDGAHQHGGHVVPPEQAVEELPDGGQPRGHVGHKEDEDNQGGDAHDNRFFLVVAFGDKAGDGDGVQLHAEPAQPLGYQQEVQIGPEGQADGGPAGVRHTGQIGQAGDAHQQIAAHVGGLGAHGGDQGAHPPAAQVEALGALFGPAANHHAGKDDQAEVEDDGPHNTVL